MFRAEMLFQEPAVLCYLGKAEKGFAAGYADGVMDAGMDVGVAAVGLTAVVEATVVVVVVGVIVMGWVVVDTVVVVGDVWELHAAKSISTNRTRITRPNHFFIEPSFIIRYTTYLNKS